MKTFIYRAKDQAGNTVRGQVQAKNEKEAARLVRERGLILVELSTSRGLQGMLNGFKHRISQKDVANFTRQLSTMINAGMSLADALSILKVQSKEQLEAIVTQILADVEGGKNFHDALSKHPHVFSTTYIALVRAGETGGVLDKVLLRLADNLEKEEAFKGKVRSAMVYPVIVIVAMILAALVMIIFVIPRLTEVYEQFGADIPFTMLIFTGISSLITNYWVIILILLLGAVLFARGYFSTTVGQKKLDDFLFKIPLVGPLRQQIILTNLSRTMAITIGAGVPILESLGISAEVINSIRIRESVRDVSRKVEKGFPISYSFSQHPDDFPYLFSQMVSVGEETGKMEEVLDKVSKVFESESEEKVKAITSAIEPMVMIFLGIGVFLLVVSVIIPIYNLTNVI